MSDCGRSPSVCHPGVHQNYGPTDMDFIKLHVKNYSTGFLQVIDVRLIFNKNTNHLYRELRRETQERHGLLFFHKISSGSLDKR